MVVNVKVSMSASGSVCKGSYVVYVCIVFVYIVYVCRCEYHRNSKMSIVYVKW